MKQYLRIKTDVYELVCDSHNVYHWVSALGVVLGPMFSDRETAINFAEERVKFYGAFDSSITWKGNVNETKT